MIRERPLWVLEAAIVAIFWRPLTIGTLFFRDLYQLFYPKKEFLVAAIRSGQIPLWDPLTNGGQPFLASPTNTPFYPSNLLFFVLPFRFAFNFDLVLHVMLCALGAYWLARTLRFSQAAAFVSGAGFALCGYTMSAINLSLPIHALPWVPVTLALLIQRPRWAGVAASLPLFAGSAELTAMLFLTMIAWAIAVRRPRAALTAIAIAIGLSLVQTIPAAQMIANSSRSHARSYEAFTTWSVDPRRLPELVVPRFFGPTGTLSDADYWGRERESNGFPYILSIYFGIPLIVLAIAGAAAPSDGFPRKTLIALAAFGFLLSLGRFLPGFPLVYRIPLIATFRYPVKFLMLALLPVALLAGRGLDARPRRWWAVAGAAIAVVCAFFPRVFFGVALSEPQRIELWTSVARAAIAAMALAIVLGNRAIAAAVVALDLLVAAYPVNVYAPRALFDEPPLARVVRKVVGPMRFYNADRVTQVRAPTNEVFWLARRNIETLSGYTATMFGIATVFHTDYDGLAPERIVALRQHLDLRVLRDAGVRAFMSRGVLRVIPNASPAWFEGNCAGNVRMTSRAIDASTYAATAPCEGRIVFAETDDPGWRVTIDGRDAPVERANFAFSAVRVSAGTHAIARTYRPRIWWAGIAGTLLTIIAMSTRSLRRRPYSAPLS